MKKLCFSVFLLVLGAAFTSLKAAQPENAEFPGVGRPKPAEYEAAGLRSWTRPSARSWMSLFLLRCREQCKVSASGRR